MNVSWTFSKRSSYKTLGRNKPFNSVICLKDFIEIWARHSTQNRLSFKRFASEEDYNGKNVDCFIDS